MHTLLDALNNMAIVPERKVAAPMRLPISGAYKIKGVGDVLAGRVEQGEVKPGDEVVFLPTHTTANPCVGKVFTVEMHHKRVDKAGPGDNVGMNIKGLDKGNMPRTGEQQGRGGGRGLRQRAANACGCAHGGRQGAQLLLCAVVGVPPPISPAHALLPALH